MNEIFPIVEQVAVEGEPLRNLATSRGITLRDHYAGMALNGLCAGLSGADLMRVDINALTLASRLGLIARLAADATIASLDAEAPPE